MADLNKNVLGEVEFLVLPDIQSYNRKRTFEAWTKEPNLQNELDINSYTIERTLRGFSNNGSPIYFTYRLLKGSKSVLPLKFKEWSCLEVCGDLWVHCNGNQNNQRSFSLHLRDYTPKHIEMDDIVFYPLDINWNGVGISYGQSFLMVKLVDPKGAQKWFLIDSIVNLVTTLEDLSKFTSWDHLLADGYSSYYKSKIDQYLGQLYEYYFSPETLYYKYYSSVVSIQNAADYMFDSIKKWAAIEIKEYVENKDKYLHEEKLDGFFTNELSLEVEKRIWVFEKLISNTIKNELNNKTQVT